MNIINKIQDKWERNSRIYAEAYRAGEIAGFNYTWLLWKEHTKFLMRMRNSEDHQKCLRRMKKFWEDNFIDVIKLYENMPVYGFDKLTNRSEAIDDDGKDAIIWIYWNDPSTMPLMVKKCIERISCNSNGHRVVVVTEKTVTDYLHLDDVIWRKYRKGKISRTHFSDIVRIALLYIYGGVWMDCTLLLTQPLPDYVTSADFYTNHQPTWDDHNISGGRWSTFFMACHRHNLMMRATLDVFVEYWKRYDYNVDYVWMDYIFDMIYDHIPSIKNMIDAVPVNNPDVWILQLKIDKACSKEDYEALFQDKNRFLYKLSCKKSIGDTYRDKDGNITLLGRICG